MPDTPDATRNADARTSWLAFLALIVIFLATASVIYVFLRGS